MKYQIQETIIVEENDTETVKDFVYRNLTEQEFLVEYLRNPKLAYWVLENENTKQYYKNGKLMVTIRDGVVTNHSFLEKKDK